MERSEKMEKCIFCRIANHQMPTRIIYEDEEVIAFHDINPQAPVHLLIIPRKHIPKIDDLQTDDQALMGKLIYTARQLADQLGFKDSGYRLVINNGRDGGQDIYHIHLHMLAGRPMHWPPG